MVIYTVSYHSYILYEEKVYGAETCRSDIRLFMYRKVAFVGVMNENFNFYLKSCGEEAN
jgi:hypothetical protein